MTPATGATNYNVNRRGPKYIRLRNSAGAVVGRWARAVQAHQLSAPSQVGTDPWQRCTTQSVTKVQTVDERLMIDCVERFWQIQRQKASRRFVFRGLVDIVQDPDDSCFRIVVLSIGWLESVQTRYGVNVSSDPAQEQPLGYFRYRAQVRDGTVVSRGRVVHGSLFLDPTRPAETLTRPDPTRDCRQKVWPDPTRCPTLPQYV